MIKLRTLLISLAVFHTSLTLAETTQAPCLRKDGSLGLNTLEKYDCNLVQEIIKDSKTSVIPEFDTNLEKEIVKDWPKPPFFDAYEGMDTGGKDLTVVLYGYYDFRAGKIIVEEEAAFNSWLSTQKSIAQVVQEEN